MSAALDALFSPFGLVVALLLSASWIWCRPHSLGARRFLLIAAVFYTLASVYEVPPLAARLLATGYDRFTERDATTATTGVVVLGGGTEFVHGWDDSWNMLDAVGAARVLEAWRVFRTVDPAWIISSGGLSHPTDPSRPSALTMREALMRLGVPESRIKVGVSSANTHDEAVVVAPMLRSLNVQRLILVTSDVHMRRSVGAFRAQGWEPIPAIAPDPRASLPPVRRFFPNRHGLSFSADVAHELVGLPYYWIRGWWR
jgi:uncharacterized SAM-binding protein YcdF (DUF218 family)